MKMVPTLNKSIIKYKNYNKIIFSLINVKNKF